jgi:hypothetical protein
MHTLTLVNTDYMAIVPSNRLTSSNNPHCLAALLSLDHARPIGLGRAGACVLQGYAILCQRPLNSISQIKAVSGLRFSTTSKTTEILAELGLIREITVGRSNRLFAYGAYLTILSEGSQPI